MQKIRTSIVFIVFALFAAGPALAQSDNQMYAGLLKQHVHDSS